MPSTGPSKPQITTRERVVRDAAVMGTIDALREEADKPSLGHRLVAIILAFHLQDIEVATKLVAVDEDIARIRKGN